MHHVHINNLLNHNQFGFTPKKCTTDAAVTVKQFIEEGLRKGLITILVSLDVKGAFNAAWWQSIRMTLKDFNPLNPEFNPICYLLALLGAHHFLHVSRIRVKY